MVLAQLHRLKMEVSFSEADIGKVRKGQTATVAVDSMEGAPNWPAKSQRVDVLPSEGSSGVVEYPATILLTQSAKGLRAGMSASAEVVVEQVKNAVTVPSEAISSAGDWKTVTVEGDGKEVTKTIRTGLDGDEKTEVDQRRQGGPKAGPAGNLGGSRPAPRRLPKKAGNDERLPRRRAFPAGGAGGFTPPTGGTASAEAT